MGDPERARALLRCREQGFSILRCFRMGGRRYLLSAILFCLLLYLASRFPHLAIAWVGVGAYIGMFLRDLGWYRAAKKNWPFTVKTTNWERVREIADGGNCQSAD